MSDTAIAVAGTVIAGLGGTALGWFLNARSALQRWQQDKRLDAYVGLLGVLERARDAARSAYFTGPDEADYIPRMKAYREAFRTVDDAGIKARLLGSDAVRRVLAELIPHIGVTMDRERQAAFSAARWAQLSTSFDALYQRFDSAARKDLGLSD